MRKYILGGFAALGIVVITAWNINLGLKNDDLSDVSLANVEALAQSEDNQRIWIRYNRPAEDGYVAGYNCVRGGNSPC